MMRMSKDEKNQIVTSLRVDPELWKKAKMEAIKCDMTLGRLVDEAVRDWIERKKKGIEK